jgi:DNA (cytosine-5)-methyltransferase 1
MGDITRLDGAKLAPVDIICGGSPCQDLSVASCTRAGLAGARSGLFLEQIRVTKEMRDADIRRGRTGKSVRPRWFCWENVPGVFSSGFPKGEDFRFVLEQIAGIAGNSIPFTQPHPWGWQPAGKLRVGAAFSLAWKVFDAQYWPGTPQRRRRVFLVADFAGQSAPKILFDQESLPGHSAQGEEAGKASPTPTPCGPAGAGGADQSG